MVAAPRVRDLQKVTTIPMTIENAIESVQEILAKRTYEMRGSERLENGWILVRVSYPDASNHLGAGRETFVFDGETCQLLDRRGR